MPTPSVVIRPAQGWAPLRLSAVWEYRELLYFLVWRDIKVRYKQTVAGAAWAILQPLLTMALFSVVLGRLVGMPTDGVPYPIFAYTALLPWQLFSHVLGASVGSLVASQGLITKVYFPRLVIPLATVLADLADFAVAFLVLLGMMVYYRIIPGVAVAFLPVLILLALGTALAVGLWLSVLNVHYRDIGQATPFLTQLWLFATPVVYPASLVPESWRWVLGLNPMTGVVEGFRWSLLGTGQAPGLLVGLSAVVAGLTLTGALYYFRRLEANLADVI